MHVSLSPEGERRIASYHRRNFILAGFALLFGCLIYFDGFKMLVGYFKSREFITAQEAKDEAAKAFALLDTANDEFIAYTFERLPLPFLPGTEHEDVLATLGRPDNNYEMKNEEFARLWETLFEIEMGPIQRGRITEIERDLLRKRRNQFETSAIQDAETNDGRISVALLNDLYREIHSRVSRLDEDRKIVDRLVEIIRADPNLLPLYRP